MLAFEDFKKLDLRIARIINARLIPNSLKLLQLEVDLGDSLRQIVSGIGDVYDPGKLIGKEIVIIANLEPKTFMGLESQGMLLAADDQKPVLLVPETQVRPGSKIC